MRATYFSFAQLKSFLAHLCVSLTILLTGCGGGSSSNTPSIETQKLSGPTSFISAETSPVLGPTVTFRGTAADSSTTKESSTRTVIEGDIYRVLDAGKTLLNLNPNRGLQVIDLTNPVSPKIIGRAAMSGAPVEMYRVNDRVYVLLNDWSEYRPVLKGGKEILDSFHGGAVITVDISRRDTPKIVGTTRIGGSISSSRMSTGNGKNALYVAAQQNGASYDSAVLSFSIDTQGALQAKTSLSLGGYVYAIQASGNRLMVANNDYSTSNPRSRVSVIDISSPEGVMIKGAEVNVSGIVQQKNNMHVQGNIMRIVSRGGWGNLPTDNTNHVETFNIEDIQRPIAIDHDTFGSEQQLFGTIFMADKAFFVTYLRKDPFHAFSITADGVMKEESEFIVSGWNDFFVPTQSNTRLLGVGHNDENNRRSVAISLYDVTNLKNTKPLIARAEIDLSYSWSEANWDDRAFTVLDNATSITADDAKTLETGLVLLPFTAWDDTSQVYQSGVQLFTFSANTLTRRGIMRQESQVRRSFISDETAKIAANLSDSELTLFGIANPSAPVAKSKLALVSNLSQFAAFSNVGVRYRVSDYSWWGNNSSAKRTDAVELVALNDVDNNAPLASLTVPENSKIYNVDGKLVVVSTEYDGDLTHTTITTYDVSNPAKPQKLGSLTTDDILSSVYYYGIADMRICGFIGRCGGRPQNDIRVVGRTLVFTSQTSQATTENVAKGIFRYATTNVFQIVNLSDATRPILLPKLSMAKEEDTIGVIQNGNSLWVNYKKTQSETTANGEPLAKYYVKELNLSTPTNIVFGKEINIPGQLMAVVADKMYTFEYNWKAKELEPSLNMVIVQNGLAYLQASVNLAGKSPNELIANEQVVLLNYYDMVSSQTKVSIFNVPNKEFLMQSTIDFDDGINFVLAQSGKLLLRNWHGLFIYDISQVKSPSARAYFPAISWGGGLTVTSSGIFLPANYYGIYQFNFNTVNLTAG